MNAHPIAAFGTLLILLLLSACGTNGESTEIAEPKAYKATADETLGTNEEGKGLAPGTRIDSVELFDIDGKTYPLERSWQQKPALIIFYRGGWCPYCNMQVRELAVNYQKLADAGVQPILISVDAPDNTAKLSATYEIPFPVLSDPELKAHEQFNVLLEIGSKTAAMYKLYGIDLNEWSGQEHNTIAVASTFLVGTEGEVLASHTVADYRQRPSIDQLLALIAKQSTETP